MSRFSVEIFLSHCAEKFRRGTLLCCVSENFVATNFTDKSGGSIKIFCRKFFVSQCRKISLGNPSMLCFRKSLVAKKFMDKRAVGVSRVSVENFLSHSSEKTRRGTL